MLLCAMSGGGRSAPRGENFTIWVLVCEPTVSEIRPPG